MLDWLFEEERPEGDFHGLENTQEIVERHSGKLSLSGTEGETLLQLSLRF